MLAESYITEFQKYFQKFVKELQAENKKLLISLKTFSVHPEGNKVFMQWFGRDLGLLAEIIKKQVGNYSGKYDQ
jgi:predicted naringenin-chalcone synthase